jgi:hypothetical protein
MINIARTLTRLTPVSGVLHGLCLASACMLGLPVAAQSATSTELASNAMATPAVRSLLNAQNKSNASSKANDHEAHLAAIRQAILNATMDRPTRVISTAWVDQHGALHEAAHFHSEAKVSGIRVLAYLPQDESQTQITADVLPWGYQANKADTSCAPAPRAWRQTLTTQTHAGQGFSGPQLFASQMLLNMAHDSWHHSMKPSQRWRMQTASTQQSSAYLRALSASEEAHSNWFAHLSLLPHGSPLPNSWSQRLLNPDAIPAWRWTLRLVVGQRVPMGGPVQAVLQFEHTLTIDPSQLALHPSRWQQHLQTEIQAQVSQWAAQLEKRTECEPVQFQVLREGTETLQLQAGAASGLRAGDRVLLMDPSHIPSRMLEPGIAQHLALAQIVRVGNNRSELQQLAGPRLPAHGAWLALPL